MLRRKTFSKYWDRGIYYLGKTSVSEPEKNRISWVIKNIRQSLKNLKLKTFNTVLIT